MEFRFDPMRSILQPLTGRTRLSGKPLTIACDGHPMRVEMGEQTLEIYPDRPLCGAPDGGETAYRIVDPNQYFDRIGHFARLAPGKTFAVDSDDEDQAPLFSDPRAAYRRNLRIEHRHDSLRFSDRISDLGTFLSPIVGDPHSGSRLVEARRQALRRILDIHGGPLRALDPEAAIDRVRQVNEQLRQSDLRPGDVEGNPGALLELPASLTPVMVGDLHGQVDNLLSVLCENDFLHALENRSGCLLLLGDAVHSDVPNQLEDTDGSVLIMDIIFSLMLAFPGRVFLLLGNHDSFSPDVMKSGVPQGIIWEKALRRSRGEQYTAELATFYELCPLVAVGEEFVACHAGPIRKRVSRDQLINVRQSPQLVHDLMWNRVKSPGFPSGYGRGDVKRFRKSLELPKKTDFVVGHYVLSEDETIWRNVMGIKGHHIIYSAELSRVGVFTRVGGIIVPQIYRCEALTQWAAENLVYQAAVPA